MGLDFSTENRPVCLRHLTCISRSGRLGIFLSVQTEPDCTTSVFLHQSWHNVWLHYSNCGPIPFWQTWSPNWIRPLQPLTGTIREKDAAIAKLTEEVSYLRKKLFGASSEKRPDIDPNQLSLFDVQEGMEIPVADIEEAEEPLSGGISASGRKSPRWKSSSCAYWKKLCYAFVSVRYLKEQVCPRPAVLPSGAGFEAIRHTDHQGIHGRLDHPRVPAVFPVGRAVLP